MLKKILHTVVWRSEQVIDQLRGQRDKRRIIEPYLGYATPDYLVLRGRVLTALRQNNPKPDQSRWTNFKQMFALFLTDEVANVEVTAGGITAFSDSEGYFTLLLPRKEQTGWQEVTLRIADDDTAVQAEVLIPDENAAFAVVSDIDDTLLQTGAYALWRNLWTSLTGNSLTRHIFPDAQSFLADLSDSARNPVYYVSSSPWNLYSFLTRIFERANLVKGPKFLRDLGVSETQFITGTHGDHKGSSIDSLLAANPDLPHVLVGDTGQHDAFVYRDAILRHPGRIAAVVLREPGPGPDDKSRAAMREISATGTLLLHGTDFNGFAVQIQAAVRKWT